MLDAAKNNPAQPENILIPPQQKAEYQVQDIQYSISGATFKLKTASAEYVVNSPLLGHFNIEVRSPV